MSGSGSKVPPPLPKTGKRPKSESERTPETDAPIEPTDEPKPLFDDTERWADKIQVTEEVDRGAMAYVLKGLDTTLRRDVALKVSPVPKSELPRAQLARFVEEAQVTAQLEHPNVVPVHELGVAPDGRAFFSMKLVRGRSLESILEARHRGDEATLEEFGLRRLLEVFLNVLQAIDYAHSRGVVHRDLKPANIMVGGFGEVLVMDWGVAKVMGRRDLPSSATVTIASVEDRPTASIPDEVTSVRSGKRHLATQLGTVIGTPAYMAPEQAKGIDVDERADLHALGVILYEILCGELPYEGETPQDTLVKVLTEEPVPPSEVNEKTPPALEALTLALLEKEPERRVLTIPEIRLHIQNYVEGIEREFGRESLWSGALWVASALGLFAFLVWYVTGESIVALFVLAPATVFNAFGWLMVLVALSYPLWSALVAFRSGRRHHGRFEPVSREDLFISGYLARRTFAAALVPLSQLAFIGELVWIAVLPLTSGRAIPVDTVARLIVELREEWARALIVVLVLLFSYAFFLYREVRFARRIDRYETLVVRSRWESVWPVGLIVVLLFTIGLTDMFDWVVVTGVRPIPYLQHAVLGQALGVFDVAKTLVFQGTFLMGLVVATVLLAFPAPEVLAALRLPYQPSDLAAVAERKQYYLRSLAVFRVARVNWLYGGAMIGSLSALTILSGRTEASVPEQLVYVLGPSLIGFIGYLATRRQVDRLLATSPAIQRMVRAQVHATRVERARARVEQLSASPIRWRLFALTVPAMAVAAYLLFTGSGLHRQSIRKLVVPVTTDEWLLILPYVALVPLVLVGDWVQVAILRWWLKRSDHPAAEAGEAEESPASADAPG